MKWVVFVLLASLMVGCGPQQMQSAPPPAQPVETPGSSQPRDTPPTPGQVPINQQPNYTNSQLPPITIVYSMTVEVLAAPGSITQFTLEGSSSASSYNGTGYASGYIKGETSGKGFLRVKILRVSTWDPFGYAHTVDEENSNLAKPGDIVLLKTVDSKMSALGQGDVTVVQCRVDQELLDPVGQNEVPFLEEVTKEFDLCRMKNPQFTPPSK